MLFDSMCVKNPNDNTFQTKAKKMDSDEHITKYDE